MDSTNFIKNLILQKYTTLKNFSDITNIPPSTLSTIFKNGIGSTSVETFIKICKDRFKSAIPFQPQVIFCGCKPLYFLHLIFTKTNFLTYFLRLQLFLVRF